MKVRYLTVLAVPAILGACSTVDTQCKDELCATVFRNVGGIGDTFYTSVVVQDEKIVAVVGDSQASPAVSILSAGIVSAGIVGGGAAFVLIMGRTQKPPAHNGPGLYIQPMG